MADTPIDRRCTYGKIAGCEQCEHIVYRNCLTFIQHHCVYLTQGIQPDKKTYDKDAQEYLKGSVLYVVGNEKNAIGRLKSNAVNWALRTNNRVVRIDTGKAMNYIMSPRDDRHARVSDWWNQAKGFYCDFTRRDFANDKTAEIMSVLQQFVTIAVEEGGHVFLRTDYPLEGFDWIRV